MATAQLGLKLPIARGVYGYQRCSSGARAERIGIGEPAAGTEHLQESARFSIEAFKL